MRMCLNCSGFEFAGEGQKACRCQVPHFMVAGDASLAKTPQTPPPAPRNSGPMKNGDIVFFKVAKPASHRMAPLTQFKGHGFGILLGHVPPFQKDPPIEYVFRQLGVHGFLTFDDVGEFLGVEAAAECVRKFEDKYYGKAVADTNQAELPLEPSKLVDAGGAPIGGSHAEA